MPDLAGWRRERKPTLPDEAYFTIAPSWVCEALSPSTTRHDRGKTMAVYARERVGHLWLLNPIEQLLEVYRLADGHWLLLVTHEGDAKVRAEPFDAIELELALLQA